MRLLILLAGLALAGGAIADDKKIEVKVDRIEMKSGVADKGDDDAQASKDTSSQTKARDYNSSRSNKADSIDADDDGDSVETKECTDSVDSDCTGKDDESPANHNTTRSRR